MNTAANLEMNADDDHWDDLAERWFQEFEDQVGEPSGDEEPDLV